MPNKIVIDTFENIEIDIPDTKGGVVTLTVPPLDCINLHEGKAIDAKLQEIIEETGGITPTQIVAEMLKYWNSTKKAQEAIDNLTTRQLVQLDNEWEKYNEIDITVGESEASDES